MRTCPQCLNVIETDECQICALNSDVTATETVKDSEPIHPRTAQSTVEEKAGPEHHPVVRKKCPDCGAKVQEGARACESCGLIFFTKPAHSVDRPQMSGKLIQSKKRKRRMFAALSIGVFLLLLYSLPQIKMIFAYATRADESEILLVTPVAADTAEFDRTIEIRDSPAGLAWSGQDFVVGKQNSFEFIRVTPVGGRYAIRRKWIGKVRPLTRNNTDVIGYREREGWFANHRFTIHHPSTLSIVRDQPAPESIGGLAWDGFGYWAATRNDPPYLYRLNKNFEVTNKLTSPSSSCAGITWDGSNLWFLDDLAMKIYVLDVKGVQVRNLESLAIPIRNPSGIAYDGTSIWIGDSPLKRILRLARTPRRPN